MLSTQSFVSANTTAIGNISSTSTLMNGSEKLSTYQMPFDETDTILIAVAIFFFLVCGLLGNSFTIAVILSYAALSKSVFMRFILSLCVSDLLSTLVSWLFLYRRTWGFDEWEPMPNFLCQVFWGTDFMTSYVTAFHVLSFALLRFVSLRFPFVYSKIKLVHVHIYLTVLWSVCFVFGFLPFTIFHGVEERDRNKLGVEEDAGWPACTVQKAKYNAYQVYQKIAYPIFLILPTVGVIILCLAIIIMISMRKRKVTSSVDEGRQRRKERNAVVQLVFIITSFLIGYVPFVVYEYWSVGYSLSQDNDKVAYWFNVAQYLCLRFSECLNPLFYNLGSPKMKKYSKEFLLNITCYKQERGEENITPSAQASEKAINQKTRISSSM